MSKNLIDEILATNREHSCMFRRTVDERRVYRRNHPTEIMATMCMDGRINLALMCGMFFGIVCPFRNIGGKYEIGWPLMRQAVDEWERFAYHMRRDCLMIVTYHWSHGDTKRGCAGFCNDREAAIRHMADFISEVKNCYGDRINTLLVGIETDSEAIVVHGEHGEVLDMRQEAIKGHDSHFRNALADMLPTFPEQVRNDIVPILLGNAKHVLEVMGEDRQLNDFMHRERVLVVGQGVNWFGRNTALVVGHCDPVISEPIKMAATIIRANWKDGRIPQGGVLMASTPYRRPEEKKGAVAEAKFMANLALKTVRIHLPDMEGFFTPLVGVVDYDTRLLEVVEHRF